MSTELFIEGLEVDAWIGVHHHERGRCQKLRIDLAVQVAAPTVDQLEDTVDYDHLQAIVFEIVARGHCELVEVFAAQIVQTILQDVRVFAVDLRVAKPEAMQGVAASAGARVIGRRG